MYSRLIMNIVSILVFMCGCTGIALSPLNMYAQTPWVSASVIGIFLLCLANTPPEVIEIKLPDTQKYHDFIDVINTRMDYAIATGITPTGKYDRETSITKLDTAQTETPRERCERLNKMYPQFDHREGVYDKETKTTTWVSHKHPLRETA